MGSILHHQTKVSPILAFITGAAEHYRISIKEKKDNKQKINVDKNIKEKLDAKLTFPGVADLRNIGGGMRRL